MTFYYLKLRSTCMEVYTLLYTPQRADLCNNDGNHEALRLRGVTLSHAESLEQEKVLCYFLSRR